MSAAPPSPADDRCATVLGLSAERIVSALRLSGDPEDVAFAGGSRVEGLCNRASDLDIYVISEHPPGGGGLQFDSPGYVTAIEFVGDERLDVEYWRRDRLRALAEGLVDFQEDTVTGALIGGSERKLLHRLRTGMPVLNPEGFRTLRGQFDFARLAEYLVRCAVRRLDNAVDDLVGMMEDDQRAVAMFRARDVLDFAADAWISHLGATNTPSKWRAKLLRSLPPGPLNEQIDERYLRLHCRDGNRLLASRESFRAHCIECLEFSEFIMHRVQP